MTTKNPDLMNVSERYRPEEWPPANVAGGGLVTSFLPDIGDRHALVLEGRDHHEPNGVRERYVSAVDPGVRVLVDILRYASAEDARQGLIDELRQISAPWVPSCEERALSIGEVGYCSHGNPITSLLFVRGNILARLRSVGSTPVHIPEVAATIDEQIAEKMGVSLLHSSPGIRYALNVGGAPYNDLYSRDNFGDSGVVPSLGNPSMSPDIIPLQSGTLTWPLVQTSYEGPDLGKPIVNSGVNNIYVRAKNAGANASSGTVNLYYSKASVFLLPSTWIPVMTPSGEGSVPLVDSNASRMIASGALALTNPAFLLTGLPQISNDHYCFISVIQTPTHPVVVPKSFPSNAAFAQWVQNTPAVAWRNLTVVPNGQTQIVRAFQFGNINPGGAYFYFTFTAQGCPTGTNLCVQCTDATNRIEWSGSLPAPDPQGNQITGFQNWVIGNFTGSLVVTLTSPSGAFPPGTRFSFKYYQVPTSNDALHRSVGRLVEVAQVHETLGPQRSMQFLIQLGECTLIVP
ncbi:hypothetical protein [Archangium violaceum]|uniref:Uncharacterized protein n=1 Tax=Archangium violaceum Cb vi76 TaxID=1406225 RepID=A0A084SVX7_9BACT|nr:hypothetical protein [Archangium violaceum]KFA92612.1 hypothetical protein Q664_14290 [Archangium violaceum Cb vi76]